MARSNIEELHDSCNLWRRRAAFTMSFESTEGDIIFEYANVDEVYSSILRGVLNSLADIG